MYYDSKEIDEDLKCSVCKQKFSGDVRLIPDCGESVCECCYEELKDSVDRSSRFKCRACQGLHTLPESGLPVNKGLSKIVKRRKVEKSLSDEAKTLKCAVESLKSQLRELESFDETEYINQHCDQLEIEVMEEIGSIVKELNEIETDLLKKIKEYRKSCLDSRLKRLEDRVEEVKPQLDALRKDMVEFNVRWTEYFDRIDALATEKEIARALDMARRFEKKIHHLRMRVKMNALNGQTMTLTAIDSFLDDPSMLRRTIRLTLSDDRVRELEIETISSHLLVRHTDQVNQVVFLEDGNLASCADDESIRIWDVVSGDMLFKLYGHGGYVCCLAALRNGHLASGSADTTIKIWDLATRREIRTLEGHNDSVASLKTLNNGNLVSFSHDDTIKIWNPHTATNQLLLTINGQDFTKWIFTFPYGVLSNDNLVTLKRTNAKTTDETIRVWNHKNGELVKSVPSGLPSPSAMLILSDDRIALGSDDGAIKIVNLDDEAASITLQDPERRRVLALAQLPNGDLVSCSLNSLFLETVLCVWNMERRNLLQTIKTGHTDDVSSITISPDTMTLATGSYDYTIRLWPIN